MTLKRTIIINNRRFPSRMRTPINVLLAQIFIFHFSSLIKLVYTEDKLLRPNIVFIIADDLGWDDVSFHGSDQILTPNIDLLAYTGITLERSYTHCICTPSRSALLTGKYAHTIGMQGYPLTNGEERGLSLSEKILPQYLKELGYATHLVGKWHVGHYSKDYWPTFRGFDSYFGHLGGFIDYYEYLVEETWPNLGKVSGLDLQRNLTPAWDAEGYITDLYNDEAKSIIKNHDVSKPLFLVVAHNAPHSGNDGALLQAPPETVRAMRHVESPERRIYAAMVHKLDDSIGDITKALLDKGILGNTIIIFISDNGGRTSGTAVNYASNWPLRGIKMSPFEGGVRVPGILWSPIFNITNNLWKGYFHVADWLPTLLSAAGGEIPQNLDGIDLWDCLTSNKNSRREEFFEIDDYTGFATVTFGDYKLLTGTVEENSSTYQGGDLRGIIGNPPEYVRALESSKVYSILNDIGEPFSNQIYKIDDLRNNQRITCAQEQKNTCNIQEDQWCLFNIKEDPCEYHDLSNVYPDELRRLKLRLQEEMKRVLPRKVPLFRDPRALPKLFNYTWSSWYDAYIDEK